MAIGRLSFNLSRLAARELVAAVTSPKIKDSVLEFTT